MGSAQQPWEQIVSQKREIRDRLLAAYLVDDVHQRPPRVSKPEERSRVHDDPLVQKITDIDNIEVLLGHLQQGDFGAEQIVKAYIRR